MKGKFFSPVFSADLLADQCAELVICCIRGLRQADLQSCRECFFGLKCCMFVEQTLASL